MQLPCGPGPTPPPPLASLWERVMRAGSLPPDLDVDRLYVAIRDRLRHPEPEVRLHALRVLADALPIAGRALTFPFDETAENLGHCSPNVRKAALDALKVFCAHCEEPECAARALLDECMYRDEGGSRGGDGDARTNVVTGLVLSIPSLLNILKRRDPSLTILPIFRLLGDMLFDTVHRDIALRSLVKLRRVCGPREYMDAFSRLDPHVQHKFRTLYEMHDEDSVDVYYARKKTALDRDDEKNGLVAVNRVSEETIRFHGATSTDSSSEESYVLRRESSNLYNGFAKVIIETEIKFDADTAITMTVLEQNETEGDSDRTGTGEEDRDSDESAPKCSDGDSEDTDVVVSQKRVRFGGESVKIRTPDSDNLLNSEDDKATGASSDTSVRPEQPHRAAPAETVPQDEVKSEQEKNVAVSKPKRSGIPLPIIQNKRVQTAVTKLQKDAKQKSKSLNELYNYFRNRNDVLLNKPKVSGFALTLTEVRSPEKVPSPVPEHKEVEVLHNLQRSPVCSPKRHTTLQLEHDGFVLNVLAMSPREDNSILSPRPPTPLLARYDWETTDILPQHVVQQLHNTENWIAVVRAADQLHSALLKPENVAKVEPAALSLVRHMWALSETVPAARAPAEGAVCALVRSSSSDCARKLLPALISRLTKAPSPAALPHVLLQRLALHHLVDLLFDPDMTNLCGEASDVQSGQLRAALCVARAAGPAAVLAAVRRRLAGTARAQQFCQKLRERLSRPVERENARFTQVTRGSQLPIAVRRRARSTPPPAPPLPPRRLRPLPDSAPLPGLSHFTKDLLPKPIFPLPLCNKVSGEARGAAGEPAGPPATLAAATRQRPAMLRLWCCPRRTAVAPHPAPAPPAPDLVADLPALTRDSSALSAREEPFENEKERDKDEEVEKDDKKNTVDSELAEDVGDGQNHYDKEAPEAPRSPSIFVEDRTELLPECDRAVASASPQRSERFVDVDSLFGSTKSPHKGNTAPSTPRPGDRQSSPSLVDRRSTPSPTDRKSTPAALSRQSSAGSYLAENDSVIASPHSSLRSDGREASPIRCESVSPRLRDVRAALNECIVPARHEDWETIVRGLAETARLAADASASAPPAAWRAAARAAAAHVRSLRSRVARAACTTLGVLFEHRGRVLDLELEEAASALLDRCADVNRFLRADAGNALVRVACGGSDARATVALCRRGAAHRAGPARAAAAQALAELVRAGGAARALDLPLEPRTVLLRAAAELLGDATPEARAHARHLCLALAEDHRFRPLLKESMPPARYRAVEKNVDKLRCR